MSTTPESKVKEDISKYFKERMKRKDHVYYESREAGGYVYRKGTPDQWAVINGKHLEIEIKCNTGKRSGMQMKYELIFNSLGVAYCCVRSLDELIEVIKTLESN